MASLIPLIPTAIQAGSALYGAYRQRKAEKRAQHRGPIESRVSQYDPQQQQVVNLINSILTGQGEQPQGGLLGETFGEAGFKAYSEPILKQYREEIVPHLAEQFSGAFGTGAAGAQSSSAFRNALAKSGEDLALGLGQLRSRQRQDQLSALTNLYLRPYENIDIEKRGGQDVLGQGLAKFGAGGGQAIFKLLQDWLTDKYGAKPVQQGSYINKQGQITGPMY